MAVLKFVGESDTYPVFRDYEVLIPPNGIINIPVEGNISHANIAKLQLIDKTADPLIDDTATPLQEKVYPIGTTIQRIYYKNRLPAPIPAKLRLTMTKNGGVAYFNPKDVENREQFLWRKRKFCR